MHQDSQLRMLLDLAEQIGLEVRRVPGSSSGSEHPGGAMVRLKGREILFLDPAAAPSDQIGVLAGAMRNRPAIEDRFLPPEIRELIDAAEPDA